MHDHTNDHDEARPQGDGGAGSLKQAGGASASEPHADGAVTVDAKLEQIKELCEIGDFDRARPLLYDVLTEGDELQVDVAKGILAQLDA